MTYDYFGAWNAPGPAAPHSPLTSYPGIPQAGFDSADTIAKLKAKGVPAGKLLLGIGFYGRGWTGVTQSEPGGTATGAVAGTAYAKCGSAWWSYDTPSTIRGKMAFAKDQGLAGAFFWELSGDTPDGELITAMRGGLGRAVRRKGLPQRLRRPRHRPLTTGRRPGARPFSRHNGPVLTTVLFDLDGTLLDHEGAAGEAIVRSFPDADAGWLVRRWMELTEEAVDRYLAGDLDFTAQRRSRIVRLARELGLGSWGDARADAWLSEYVVLYEAAWRPFPDVRTALDVLAGRGLRLGVITNGDAAQQRAKVEGLGLADLLPYVVASSEAGSAKPAPGIFRTACAGLGVPPGEAAYVGDRLVTDARGAAAAGLTGIWLDRSGDPPPDLEVTRITSLTALPGLLG